MTYVITNEQIQRGAHRFARLLDAAGVGRSDVVALLLPNVPEFLYCYRGIGWSGRICVPVNRNLKCPDVVYVRENSGARVLVAHVDYRESAQAAATGLDPRHCFAVGGDIPGFRRLEEMNAFSDAPLDEPMAGSLMLYTSGTSGKPKGVSSHGLQAEGGAPPGLASRLSKEMFTMFLQGEAPGAHLVAGPLYHAGPLSYCEGAALLGATIVLMEQWDAEEFLRLIETHQVKSTFLVPTHFARLRKLPDDTRQRHDTRSLHLVFHGAAPVSRELKHWMIDWLGPVLFEFYGGSEGAGSTAISSEDWLRHPGSVGRPTTGCEIHILDDAGEPCETGAEGNIYFRSSRQRFAYRGDPEKTAAAYRGELSTLGDVGYLDAEGYLYLCDRRTDLVISGGVNIYPAQVEGVLLEHPGVQDCCVVGLLDAEWGERLLAVVAPTEDGASDTTQLIKALGAWCRERLAAYQVPREFAIVPTLPRTEAGKLLRREVREIFRKRAAAAAEPTKEN